MENLSTLLGEMEKLLGLESSGERARGCVCGWLKTAVASGAATANILRDKERINVCTWQRF